MGRQTQPTNQPYLTDIWSLFKVTLYLVELKVFVLSYIILSFFQMRYPALLVCLCALLTESSASQKTIKLCVSECLSCVTLFGKNMYDGALCAQNCQLSKGRNMDEGCRNEMFHLIKRSGMKTAMCQKYCVLCMSTYGKTLYNGAKCYSLCERTQGRSVDIDCENEQFHIVRGKSMK